MNISLNTGLVNRDLNLLAPFFRERAIIAIAAANDAGYPVQIFEGFRTPQRQAALLKMSQTGQHVATTKGAWQSWHQYGLAFDIAYYLTPSLKNPWSWDGNFEKPAQIIKSKGLEWIPEFELGHFQLTGGLHVSDAYQITRDYGLQTLWLEVKARLKL